MNADTCRCVEPEDWQNANVCRKCNGNINTDQPPAPRQDDEQACCSRTQPGPTCPAPRQDEQAAGGVTLTSVERESLDDVAADIAAAFANNEPYLTVSNDLYAAVERILTARRVAAEVRALREARDEMRAMLDTFPKRGSHTRAGWAVAWLDHIIENGFRADRLAATTERGKNGKNLQI